MGQVGMSRASTPLRASRTSLQTMRLACLASKANAAGISAEEVRRTLVFLSRRSFSSTIGRRRCPTTSGSSTPVNMAGARGEWGIDTSVTAQPISSNAAAAPRTACSTSASRSGWGNSSLMTPSFNPFTGFASSAP